MKQFIKKLLVQLFNGAGINSKWIGIPKGLITAEEWCRENKTTFIPIHEPLIINEPPPFTNSKEAHHLFTDELIRKQPPTFVAVVPKGRVWSYMGAVITPDDFLLEDVSRGFGKYKGVTGKEFPIFNRIHLGKLQKVKGNVAVISTCGSSNYYHWMIDVLPRFELLKLARLFDSTDFFILDYQQLPFQVESLKKLGIAEEKIINTTKSLDFHLQADELYVVSLASVLSTMNDWQVEFIRKTFLLPQKINNEVIKIYISRSQAPGRKLLNEEEVIALLQKEGYKVVSLENYSIAETAGIMNQASWVIAAHGAGLTNVAFCKATTKVIDIIPPFQLNPIYWLLSNRVDAHYGYVLSEGDLLPDGTDLVKFKRNDDFKVDIAQLQITINQMGELYGE